MATYAKFDTNAEADSASKNGHNVTPREYTREIINNLTNGIIPAYKRELAGDWAPVLELLQTDYDPDDLDSFKGTLDAVKARYPALRELLEETSDAKDKDEIPRGMRLSKTGKLVFARLRESDIDDLEDIAFLIQHILPEVGVTLLYGLSGTGKTFNGYHIAQCVARGIPWFGRRVTAGKVLYIYAEGKLGLKLRQKAWYKYYQEEKTDNITFIGLPVHLIENRQALFDTIEEMIEEEEKPDLLIIDTFSNCASGIDQNAQKEVEPVLRVCHEVKDTYNIQIMIIHHTNKSDGFNGSMAFRNHVDTMIELVPDDKDEKGTIWMKCAKQRDGAESFDPIKLRLHKVELGVNPRTLDEISSCVVVAVDREAAKNEKAQREEQDHEIMIDVLRKFSKPTGKGRNKAVGMSTTTFQKEACNAGIPVRKFNDLAESLRASGKVIFREASKNGETNLWSLPEQAQQQEMPEQEVDGGENE